MVSGIPNCVMCDNGTNDSLNVAYANLVPCLENHTALFVPNISSEKIEEITN